MPLQHDDGVKHVQPVSMSGANACLGAGAYLWASMCLWGECVFWFGAYLWAACVCEGSVYFDDIFQSTDMCALHTSTCFNKGSMCFWASAPVKSRCTRAE